MSREIGFRRHSSVPEPHIQILRREASQAEMSNMDETSVTRPSLAQEVKEGSLELSTNLANPDNISNMERGTTFAARARAAELNSARSAKASAKKDTTQDDEGDEVPAVAPVSLGSLRFTLPKRRDSPKASRPQSQATDSATTSTNPVPTNLRFDSTADLESITIDRRPSLDLKTLQSVTPSRQRSALDQQAIRQKVREVSARQQSFRNASEEEKVAHILPGSASVSPYSGSESLIGHTQAAKKAELNTQHIREIRREAEKQRDLAQARVRNRYLLSQNNVVDENQSPGLNQTILSSSHSFDEQQDSSQYLLPNLNEWGGDMSSRVVRLPDGLHTASPRSGYNASDQASLRLGASPVAKERQQVRSITTHHQVPSAAIVENMEDSQYKLTSADSIQPTSTGVPTPNEYLLPAQLRATSPAFVPSSNAGLGITYGQPTTVFPSVKGTDRRQRSKHRNQLPYLPPGTWEHSPGRFDAFDGSSITLTEDSSPTNPVEESIKTGTQVQAPTHRNPKSASLRDPLPYTGFSKKDQLYEQLQRTLDETTAKGDLPASNRSVLYDPVASATTAGSKHGSSSNTGKFSSMNPSDVESRRQKAEIPPFVFPQHSASRAEPDYDPNSLKDSEPLPPYPGPKRIESKVLSSPDDSHGYRSYGGHYSAAAPNYPPGLDPNNNPFLDTETPDRDSFWNPKLAAKSGRPLIEHSADRLPPRTAQVDTEQRSWIEAGTQAKNPKNPWIEKQKRLLRPQSPLGMKELDQAAREWFDSGKNNLEDHVKSTLQRSEGVSPFASRAKSWEIHQSEHVRTLSGSRHAPIGSERPRISTGNEEIGRKGAAIDVLGNVLANLASYHGGENPGPSQRYSQPPAWCIDHTEAGRKSFFNDNWGDVPKRVGRDPRYQKTVHEGRTTYFEDPNSSIRRDLPSYKTPPGWGSSR